MKNIYIIRGNCVIRCKYNFKAWESFLKDSRSTAEKIIKKREFPKGFDNELHFVYGYYLPKLGKYVTVLGLYSQSAFRNFSDNIYKQDSDAMIYAIHF